MGLNINWGKGHVGSQIPWIGASFKWNGESILPGLAITVQETKFTKLGQEVESLWKADGMIPMLRVHQMAAKILEK